MVVLGSLWLPILLSAMVQDAIWFARPWSFVAKHLFDALIYALVTSGIFGWLWPA